MRLHRAILRTAACLVPVRQRSEWLAEWRAELCYVNHRPMAFCLGAFHDAFWLRRRASALQRGAILSMDSPLRCLLLLSLLAAAGVFAGSTVSIVHPQKSGVDVPLALVLLSYGMLALVALMVLMATSPPTLGDYPGGRGLRRNLFLIAKILLVTPAAFGASLGIPQFFLIAEILALRWTFADQSQRCPVCLHRLTHPTRIGDASHAFLEWYGVELICAHGHGLLYVPEIVTSCYKTHRWQALDPSWSSLFL